LLDQPVGKAPLVAQCDTKVQPKGVLRIEIKRYHLLARSRQATGDVGSERGLANSTFGRGEADQSHASHCVTGPVERAMKALAVG
jgi:hypothetical protein